MDGGLGDEGERRSAGEYGEDSITVGRPSGRPRLRQDQLRKGAGSDFWQASEAWLWGVWVMPWRDWGRGKFCSPSPELEWSEMEGVWWAMKWDGLEGVSWGTDDLRGASQPFTAITGTVAELRILAVCTREFVVVTGSLGLQVCECGPFSVTARGLELSPALTCGWQSVSVW